jgi:hypothetical protein
MSSYKEFKYDKPLLDRLRQSHKLNTPPTHAMLEAADEIERLMLELREVTKGAKIKVLGEKTNE